MNNEQLFNLVIWIYILNHAFNFVLDFLNLSHNKKPVNSLLKGIFTEEKEQQSKAYFQENSKFSLLTGTISFVVILLMLNEVYFAIISDYLAQYTDNQIIHSLSFFGTLFILSDILGMPFELYSQFKIEEKYGFNKMNAKLFFLDKIKGYVIGALIGGLIFWILLTLITSIGENFWIYFLVVITVFILLINMFYTSVIMPLFNKLTPLEDGSLREKITEYSKKINFPLDNIYVMDGSKRSAKANAFFSGIGKKKKIVLYDTLIEQLSEEEIVAVLAHEVGHFKKKHIVMNIFQSILFMGVMLFTLSMIVFNKELSIAMGASDLSIHLNLLAFSFIYSPISTVLGLFTSLISRKNEYEADAYAKDTYNGEELVNALKKLSVTNLSNMNPHPAYVFFNYSHPTVLQRFEKLKE